YADYAYEEIYDRDYTPEDLVEYRRQVKEYVAPLSDELYNKLFDECYDEYKEMWEQEVTEEQCLSALYDYLPEISEDMLVPLNYMVDHELYDISVDEAKAPGGYTSSITVYNAPFMFNCASGDYSDVNTVIHEFGHYNQMYYRSEDEWYYDSTDLDLAEINSQGLELLYMDFSDEIFGEYADIMNYYNAFNQTYSTIEGCKEDAFQYAIYSEPEGMTLDKLNQLYYDMCEEYDDLQLYNSYYLGLYGILDSDCIYEWVEIPHTFQSPLYYISYSISMSAVEELRDVILEDREEGINIYLELAAAGAEKSFQETVESVGLNNPIQNPRFDEYTENIRVSIGLSEASSDSVVLEDEIEEEEIDEPEDSEIQEEDEEDDRPSRHSSRSDDEEEEDNSEQIPITLIIVIALAALLLVVVIIVLTIVISNKKKNKDNIQNNPTPNNGAPVPPMQNNGAPVPPAQGNPMNMQPGNPVNMQPGSPYMPPMQNNGAPVPPTQGNPMNMQPGNPVNMQPGSPYMPPMQNNGAPVPPAPNNGAPVPPTPNNGAPVPPTPNNGAPVPPTPNNGAPVPPTPNNGVPVPPTPNNGVPVPPISDGEVAGSEKSDPNQTV
ncbi:MAG: M3 family metallopeptidase, partial [Lachnospiraceae bacterium]